MTRACVAQNHSRFHSAQSPQQAAEGRDQAPSSSRLGSRRQRRIVRVPWTPPPPAPSLAHPQDSDRPNLRHQLEGTAGVAPLFRVKQALEARARAGRARDPEALTSSRAHCERISGRNMRVYIATRVAYYIATREGACALVYALRAHTRPRSSQRLFGFAVPVRVRPGSNGERPCMNETRCCDSRRQRSAVPCTQAGTDSEIP